MNQHCLVNNFSIFKLDGRPLICGGCIELAAGCSPTDKCFTYDALADTWVDSGSMSGYKFEVASDYTASFGLAMADASNDALEVTEDGINFELIADYPNPDVADYVDSGCLVILDEKNLFLAGGYTYDEGTSRAYIYNKDANMWREVGNMAEPREYHSCGLAPSSSGSGYEVIVVGGYGTETARELKKSIEIFSIESEIFLPGWYAQCLYTFTIKTEMLFFAEINITFGIQGAYDIHVDDTFVMVGGYLNDFEGDGSYALSDKLIKYLPESGTFMELPGKLKIPRHSTTAILVDRSIFPPCP